MSIKIQNAVPVNQILFCTEPQVSVGVIVSKDTIKFVTENGRKIVKAGTPLSGDMYDRSKVFQAAVDEVAPAEGVLLHDVDITDGDANGTLLIFGFVNIDRLDNNTRNLITQTRMDELNGKIIFLK